MQYFISYQVKRSDGSTAFGDLIYQVIPENWPNKARFLTDLKEYLLQELGFNARDNMVILSMNHLPFLDEEK